MGCGCSKSHSYTQSSPLVLGDDDGEAPGHYRTTVAIVGMKAGSDFWARGTGVAPMVVSGWLVPL
jgi:hypothetical protein